MHAGGQGFDSPHLHQLPRLFSGLIRRPLLLALLPLIEEPILLVLDDLHWADEPSLLMLQFLARQIDDSHLFVDRHRPIWQEFCSCYSMGL